MGTRAVITFKDDTGTYSVYQHWDGDPETIFSNLERVVNCWGLPRFEADEFAAAYVAAHKNGAGNIRLSKGPRAHGDLSYTYTVTHNNGDMFLNVSYKSSGSSKLQKTVVTNL